MGHAIVCRWIWINVSPQTYVDILRPFCVPYLSSAPMRCVIQSCSYTTKAGTWPCDIFGLPRSPKAHCFPRQDVCSLVLHRSSNPNCAKKCQKTEKQIRNSIVDILPISLVSQSDWFYNMSLYWERLTARWRPWHPMTITLPGKLVVPSPQSCHPWACCQSQYLRSNQRCWAAQCYGSIVGLL